MEGGGWWVGLGGAFFVGVGRMILEGLVTTLGPGRRINMAPMGPVVNPDLTEFLLRPFQTSTTFRNLKHHPQGVLHVVDDVLLLAQGAVGRLGPPFPTVRPAAVIDGVVLQDACRCYEFEVEQFDERQPRAEIRVRVLHAESLRDFWGFNRAKHAVIEAAILATRLHLTGVEPVLSEYERLRVTVEKTAGPREQEAFDLLWAYVSAGGHLPEEDADAPAPEV